jgi:hypothetical protein
MRFPEDVIKKWIDGTALKQAVSYLLTSFPIPEHFNTKISNEKNKSPFNLLSAFAYEQKPIKARKLKTKH